MGAVKQEDAVQNAVKHNWRTQSVFTTGYLHDEQNLLFVTFGISLVVPHIVASNGSANCEQARGGACCGSGQSLV